MSNEISNIEEKDLPNYKIFWIDDYSKKIVLKFKANNEEEAIARYHEYCTKNNDHAYYYGPIRYCKIASKSGDKTKIRILEEHSVIDFDDECNKPIIVKILKKTIDTIGDFFVFWFLQKPIDWWYDLKDIVYLLKHKEARSNQWNLDQHLIDSIELNLPSLIKHSHGLMFLDEAIMQLHKNDEGFDLKEYHMKHCSSYPQEVEDLAHKIQNEEYNKLLLYVKLYKYYSWYGIVDITNPDEVEFDKEWRHTLPVKPGTYDEFDYDALKRLCDQAWDNIWDWVKKYGHTLYD